MEQTSNITTAPLCTIPRVGTSFPSRPLLRYHGGKWILGKWIISFFPKHRKYVEPFGGGASVLLQKERCFAEIYNDLDNEIVNLFEVVRDDGNRLKRALELTPFSRYEFEKSLLPVEDNFEKARRTVVRSYMSFSPTAVQQNITSGFRCTKIHHSANPANDWKNYPKALEKIIERLQGVLIENMDGIELMKNHDSKDTLFYVDPPYMLNTRFKKQKTKCYNFEMTDKEHELLLLELKKMKGSIILSGYENDLYNDVLTDWEKVKKDTFSDTAKARTETLWISRPIIESQKRLFV